MKLSGLNNSSAKKIVALLLVVCIGIGLISSTAIKLVSATYYMQTKRNIVTGIPAVDNFLNDIVDNNPNDNSDNNQIVTPPVATTAPATQAPVTTTAPSTSTTAPTTEKADPTEPTKAPDATEAPTEPTQEDTTAGSTTPPATEAPTTTTTEPETDSPETIKLKKQILSEYKSVVNLSKKTSKPAFTKTTYRSIDKSLITGLHLLNIESTYPDYFVSKENAVPLTVGDDNIKSELCINNNKYACMLASEDASEAIKTATSVKLKDGSKKVTIVLRDETNPDSTAVDATKAASFTSAMFPVISPDVALEKVNASTALLDATAANITYKDCTVELIYKPATKKIISLTQTVSYTGEFKGQLILTSTGTVTEVYEYKDFDYSIL